MYITILLLLLMVIQTLVQKLIIQTLGRPPSPTHEKKLYGRHFAVFSLCGICFTFVILWGFFSTMWGPCCYHFLHAGGLFCHKEGVFEIAPPYGNFCGHTCTETFEILYVIKIRYRNYKYLPL